MNNPRCHAARIIKVPGGIRQRTEASAMVTPTDLEKNATQFSVRRVQSLSGPHTSAGLLPWTITSSLRCIHRLCYPGSAVLILSNMTNIREVNAKRTRVLYRAAELT
jgi:hypothetical protein